MRNWLKHDGCDGYVIPMPHFDKAALAHMHYGKMPSTRELHVGKFKNTDRRVVKDMYSVPVEKWKNYLARCQEVYDEW